MRNCRILTASICSKDNKDRTVQQTIQCGLTITYLWHIEEDGQFSQPHPQEDLPFLRSLTIFVTISATITAKTKPIIIVEIFSIRKADTVLPPSFDCLCTYTIPVRQCRLYSYIDETYRTELLKPTHRKNDLIYCLGLFLWLKSLYFKSY